MEDGFCTLVTVIPLNMNNLVVCVLIDEVVCVQVVLHGVVNMQLPNQWLWDMVDEFVYQFQSFCQYRAKMKNKTEAEIALLQQNEEVAPCPFFSSLLALFNFV